jgi:ABC-2 type transport system ATP-binding protein
MNNSPLTNEPAVTTTGITRRFGDLTAVNDVTITVPAGGVVGFVGPNGSGKSTTIRMLLGLISPTEGTGTVLGSSIDNPSAYANRVGALIENPAFIETLTGRNNLASIAALRKLPSSRIDAVLDIVGLVGREDDRVATYSLGMKQRLGIAAALLPDPELLIFDEPTNGLDPAGIFEVRQLMARLAAEGRTVIVSSHLLSEIEAICDHLVIISFGELLFDGRLRDFMRQARHHVTVSAEQSNQTDALIRLYDAVDWPLTVDGGEIHLGIDAQLAGEANRRAAEAGIALSRVVPVNETLEGVFLRLTGETDAETAAARAAQAGNSPSTFLLSDIEATTHTEPLEAYTS